MNLKKRDKMMSLIFDRTPGIYFHVSFSVAGWLILLTLVIVVLCVQSVRITINPGPVEYPMFIDNKKIVFLGREPQSVQEARAIMATFNHHIDDGGRVAVP